ncbi:hypothetical protein OGH69_14670 [Flavobacterium sp. MFBS3-15]|uniref:hypothetical protein n=1 Tax=Flavobacterium sp. MFBS3-15 TaxID=2989816 RepID=UPI0022361497|nr:hypothetical protein [Flavobacterium sp. MFBS3-15]MCW4470218.1 hypothetical protein [Flavobacterium sp. MFBS3-15]
MGRTIKNKYFFWAIVFFGMLGIYMPIIVRIFQKSNNILLFEETVFNVVTYSISILVTSIYTIIINSSDGSESFKSKLFDHIGYIVGSIVFVLAINYLVTLESKLYSYWFPIFLSVLGCIVSWRMWFVANKDEDFGTGALGN